MSVSLDPSPPAQAAAVAPRLYGLDFWIAYAANLLVVTANTLVFRFADFVVAIGGTALVAGLIVGIATGVGIAVRIWMGRVVDRFGPRWMWIASAAALAASSLAFIPLQSIGAGIYLIRIVYACGIAGVFSCSVIHLCTGVPVERRTELIGTLGTSGFIGSIVGPQLGDWIFAPGNGLEQRYTVMFVAAFTMYAAYLGMVAFLTRRSERPVPHALHPFGQLLVHYWPGALAAVAMMMGVALTIPANFLTLFRQHAGLEGIGTFFWFYAPAAIFMRLAGRHWPARIGRPAAALLGILSLIASMMLYLVVDSDWDLAWPALAAGTGQALLFPVVTTLGAESFPERYRATGTTLILSLVDLGALCGAPLLGLIIDRFGFVTMFLTVAAIGVVVAATFLTAARRSQSSPQLASVPVRGDEQLGDW